MAGIREAGIDLSMGELDRGVGAAAVPVLSTDDEVTVAQIQDPLRAGDVR